MRLAVDEPGARDHFAADQVGQPLADGRPGARPVVEDGKLVGVVTRVDLLGALASE